MLWFTTAASSLPALLLILSATSPRTTEGNTLQDCFYCLTDEIPGMIQCGAETPECNLLTCGLGESADYEACGCTDCVDPIIQCFDECTPTCLDTVVEPFVECMVTPECYVPCLAEEPEESTAIFPPLDKPEPCTLEKLFLDPVQCLFPIFPECDVVQTSFVDPTCDVVSCCPSCHDQMIEIYDCFYKWASGYQCVFDCSPDDNKGRALLNPQGHQNHQRRKLDSSSINGESAEIDMEFVEECRQMISNSVMENPEDIVGLYMNCIISNTMTQVTSEDNKPKETIAPIMSPSSDTTEPSSASYHPPRIVFSIMAVVTVIGGLRW